MNFNSDGYLDPGVHDIDLEGIVEHFVAAFPHSSSRRTIIEGYIRHRSELAKFGIDCTQFVDGSFISSKADPGDIDLVGFMDADAVDALSFEKQKELLSLFSGNETKIDYLCDAYFAPYVAETHPMFPKLRSLRKYWMGEFGYDREDRPKGIVKTVVIGSTDGDHDGDA